MSVLYARAPNVLWRRTATAVLVRTVDGRGATLRGTGPALWDELAEPRTLTELTDRMHAVFSDPSGALDHDVQQLLQALQVDGMVVTSHDA